LRRVWKRCLRAKKEATRQIEPEVVLIQTEPETFLERQLVVEEPCVQENHFLTTSKDEGKEDFSEDVQILRKSEVAELLDFPKPKPPAAQDEQEETLTREQAPPEKVEGSSAMADAGLLVENPDKAGSVVENDFTDRVKQAESEVSRRGSFAEDDEEVKVNGHVQDEKENQPTKKEIVTQVNRADEQRPSAAESKSEKADVQDVKKEQPTKKESVAECLRRYREEEAKARRAAQMRKNYTLLDDEPEICQEEPPSATISTKEETRPKVVDKKSAKREELQQKLVLTMILSALVIFLLLASSMVNNVDQQDIMASEEECEEEVVPAWVPGPRVFWDYVEYSALSENRLRQ